MARQFQVTFDCGDPHALAAFWARALDLEVEHHDDLIARMIAEGYATEDDVMEHDGHRVWRTGAACSAEGTTARLHFQQVPEGKAAKNRMHLDVRASPDERDDVVERLCGLGATRTGQGTQGPISWVVMADPEGNEFCVT